MFDVRVRDPEAISLSANVSANGMKRGPHS